MDNNNQNEFEKIENETTGQKEPMEARETPTVAKESTPNAHDREIPTVDFNAEPERPANPYAPPEAPTNPNTAPGQTGQYSMAHPANGTTYFRPQEPGQNPPPPQGAPRQASWSSQPPYGAQGQQPPQNPQWQSPQGQNPQWQQSTNPYNRPNVNPYSQQNPYNNQRAPYGQYGYQNPAPKPKKEKKGVSAGVVAIICAATILLSGICGYLGAWSASRLRSGESTGRSGSVQTDTTVIYRSVSTDADAENPGTITDVVNAVADSVVEITTEFRSTGYFQFVSSGAGSGVIISEDGYIVTNNHVISENGTLADSIRVRLKNEKTFDATVIGRDADTDIAVIKIDATDLTAAVFGDSEKLTVGQDIVAIGNPLGELGGTVTGGIVSALDREVDVEGSKMNLLQIDAAVNPGNSGGGLFNMKGELVGIVNAKSSGSGIEGLGFAIPSNDASHIATELITNGYVTGKPYIGINLYYAENAYTAYRYFGSEMPGLYVYYLVEGYNDDVLQKGDRVAEVNGKEVGTIDDVKKIIENVAIGDKVTFTVYRNGTRTDVEVTVYEYVPAKDEVSFN